ncbi:MAG: YidC/Oxa1 family membrane protein insertase [Saccharofermentans sp.]|nr:YidC/Oxa1 family membrane protein insertase [Saccharofermentans sp.]
MNTLTKIVFALIITPLQAIFEVVFGTAYHLTDNPGLSIIILSLFVTIMIHPLYSRAATLERQERELEKKLEPTINHIKKVFKGDERFMILSAFYKENNYSPLNQLKNSISLALQVPFFLAAYNFLSLYTIFYGVSFGPIKDLSMPDALITIGSLNINLLPILMTVINIISGFVYTIGMPKKSNIQIDIVAAIFLLLLYDSPSCLVLYWTCNNIFSLIRNILARVKKAEKKASKEDKTAVKHKAFFLPALFLTAFTGLLIPSAFIGDSPLEFVNVTNPMSPARHILIPFCIAVGVFLVWGGIFYSLASTRGKKVIAGIYWSLSLIFTVDYMFFGKGLGTISTDLVYDHIPSFTVPSMAINALVVIAVSALGLVLFRKTKITPAICGIAAGAVVIMSVINITGINRQYKDYLTRAEENLNNASPHITLSKEGENVMVIMLDRAVSAYIPYIMHEYPALGEMFDGFTFYPNTISFGLNTNFGSPALFGGYAYTPTAMDLRTDELLREKHDNALRLMPLLFSDAGYDVTLMDLPYAGYQSISDYTVFKDIPNLEAYNAEGYFVKSAETSEQQDDFRERKLFSYAIMKCAPEFMTDYLYDGGRYYLTRDIELKSFDEAYSVLCNLTGMTEISSESRGGFLMMDNNTTHEVTTLSEISRDGNFEYLDYSDAPFIATDGTSEIVIGDMRNEAHYDCLIIALFRLGEYFDYLREQGVYDNTRIIIVADHGKDLGLFPELVFADRNIDAESFAPLLMFKDFDSEGFTTDNTFMTNADTPSLALQGIVEAPVDPATGTPVNMDPKSGDVIICQSDETPAAFSVWYNNGYTFYYGENARFYNLTTHDIRDEAGWVEIEQPGT